MICYSFSQPTCKDSYSASLVPRSHTHPKNQEKDLVTVANFLVEQGYYLHVVKNVVIGNGLIYPKQRLLTCMCDQALFLILQKGPGNEAHIMPTLQKLG